VARRQRRLPSGGSGGSGPVAGSGGGGGSPEGGTGGGAPPPPKPDAGTPAPDAPIIAPPPLPPPGPEEPLPACKRTVNVSDSAALATAISGAQAGDCIVLADGTYTFPTINAKATADAPVVIRAANRLKATVEPATCR
jgi:hypothetical protein